MRSLFCATVFALIAICFGKAVDPTWPMDFEILIRSAAPNATPAGDPDTRLRYSWTHLAQRLDHAGGHHECVRHYSTQKPCSLYEFSLPWPQTWVVIPDEGRCFLDESINGLAPLAPDWMREFHVVAEGEQMGGVTCDHWALAGDTGEYWDEVRTAVPVRWSPGDRKTQWWFDVSSWNTKKHQTSTFTLPEFCWKKPN